MTRVVGLLVIIGCLLVPKPQMPSDPGSQWVIDALLVLAGLLTVIDPPQFGGPKPVEVLGNAGVPGRC